jgi:hypothetical protein
MTVYPVSADIDYDDEDGSPFGAASLGFTVTIIEDDPFDDEWDEYDDEYDYYEDDEEDCE